MSDLPPPPLAPPAQGPSPERALRRLFLTLFLRGRSARGLQKGAVPKSIGTKLAWTLAVYALFGLVVIAFFGRPVFALSLYLHAMTLVFLGMFVASSAGEVLFNKEEADILLHRPVTPRALLWAKISMLLQVALWLAGAFNLAGLLVGVACVDGGWLYPLVHGLSTALEALFCTGAVVLTYQLCLRWFGRERLDNLMTTTQVLVAIVAVMGGQMAPQILGRLGTNVSFEWHSWWVGLLPPAWFAGLDDALAGGRAAGSWALAGVGLAVTGAVLWLAFGKLARNYELGLQALNEAKPARSKAGPRRPWIAWLMRWLPLRWWFKDAVARAAFLLTASYLVRDREVKLRIYPGIAPMLVMPLIFLLQERTHRANSGGFGVAFSGCYLGLIPLMALSLLQYSQQWLAADLFRLAPLAGPAPLCHGARRAVLCFLTLPALLFFGGLAWLLGRETALLPLLLPGVIALPLYALIPALRGQAVPLSQPTEEAKSVGRGVTMIGVMFISMLLAGVSLLAWHTGWFRWLLAAETLASLGLYLTLRGRISRAVWPP